MADSQSIWTLYLVRSGDNSLYTGISTDVQRRFAEHSAAGNSLKKAKGAKFFRGKQQLSLVYQIEVGNRSVASKLEYRVKQLAKIEKERLVRQSYSLQQLQELVSPNNEE